MNEFNPISIITLQDTLSSKNIEKLIQEFIKNKTVDDNYPLEINKQEGILTFYNSYKNDLIEVKFETQLKEILRDITINIKLEIDLSNTYLKNKEKIKFWDNILRAFDYVKENSAEILSTFPLCFKVFEEIENYLKDKYLFTNKSFSKNSFFTLKPKYTRQDIQNIYDFITGELYLDDEIFNFKDFYSALIDDYSKIILIFNCSTQIFVCILNELGNLFNDFSRKKIAESGRFRTKSNTPITEENFNTTISRIKKGAYVKSKEDITKIVDFFLKLSEN